MEPMSRDLISNFHKETGRICRHILIYRDGIGDGAMDIVLNFELSAVKMAWRTLYPDEREEVKVTLIVVNRHHRVRLFPDGRTSDRSGNVPSGTLVDSSINSPFDADFFLVSHPGLKGTSKPTYYTVLSEEIGLTLSQLETLSFDLCHVYARCCRAVSHPAPTFYAHLAAYRARLYVQLSDSRFRIAPLNDRLRSVMYYG
jgi:eukaryotic translation initiation factor 2C